MSVETPKVEDTTPVATKPVESTEAPVETPAAAVTTATETPAETAKESEATAPAAQEPAKDEAVVEATPASEGTLGYKEPGFLKQFRFVKHFFWFSEEPISAEAINNYVKSEKPEVAHSNAAWAQETGKGVLFYTKRAEDKAHPTGLILLHDATNVTKVGLSEFSFKIGTHTHKFEAATPQERNSWVVAVEKIAGESKDLKEDITGRESYKKTIEGYSFSPVVAGAATTAAPKKSLDASAPTTTATEPTPAESTATDAAPAEEAKKAKEAEKAKKERSQSRKRNSVFGIFGKKDEDKELKKEEKAEKKAEKEEAKEEKKLEAEQKKEEAKAEHDSDKAKEAAEAAAIAAVPASVAVAAEKHEEKKDEKAEEKSADEASPTSPTEKKSKRASVFGSLFQKAKVTSPTAEKTEKDAAPAVPAKDTDVPPVSETAPKIDEPIDTKPIDTAAVTAPVDAAAATSTTATETPKDTTPAPVAAESATTPKAEKKGFLAGLIKKPGEKKEEKAAEEIAKDPLAAAAVTDNTTTEPTTDAAVKESESPKDERPAREKRRTSLFGSLGTLKRKGDKSPAPESAAAEGTTETEVKDAKREKSPIPSKLGGLFRKPSRAIKSEKPAEEAKTDAPAASDAAKTEAEAPKAEGEAAATEGTATIVEAQSEDTKIVGDVVPDELHTTVHDSVTSAPTEVKATA